MSPWEGKVPGAKMEDEEDEEDFCINFCYYLDTPEECTLDHEGIPYCKKAIERDMKR